MAKQPTKTASTRGRGSDNSQSENVINSTEIAVLAYELWHSRGCPEGSPEVDWLEAERRFHAGRIEVAAPQISEPLLVRRSGA